MSQHDRGLPNGVDIDSSDSPMNTRETVRMNEQNALERFAN